MKADQPAESFSQMSNLPLRMPLMFERIATKVGQRPRTDRSGQDLDVSWRRNAACRDTDPALFFPVGVTGSALVQIEDAREVCMSCSCQEACLEFALRSNQDTGIWGGASEEERRHLRRTYINKRNRLATS
jgi:WhiB family redox-sensing transcriptional regulator